MFKCKKKTLSSYQGFKTYRYLIGTRIGSSEVVTYRGLNTIRKFQPIDPKSGGSLLQEVVAQLRGVQTIVIWLRKICGRLWEVNA